MDEQEKLNEAMAEFNRGQMELKREMRRFAELNGAIQQLKTRAMSDPDARERLRQLDEMMQNGGNQMKARFEQGVVRLESSVKSWADEIENLAPLEDRPPQPAGAEVSRVNFKKRNRSFF